MCEGIISTSSGKQPLERSNSVSVSSDVALKKFSVRNFIAVVCRQNVFNTKYFQGQSNTIVKQYITWSFEVEHKVLSARCKSLHSQWF